MLSSVFSPFPAFAFSGSRSPKGVAVGVFAAAAAAVPPGSPVLVGCARGVDGFYRQCFPCAEVFAVSSGQWGRGRSAFAARSCAVVSRCAELGGLWVSFPCSPCPPGLSPSSSSSRCFCGSGSGSWASLAFAIGSGLSCAVFLPAGVAAPVGWGLSELGVGWWLFSPAAVQLSLF